MMFSSFSVTFDTVIGKVAPAVNTLRTGLISFGAALALALGATFAPAQNEHQPPVTKPHASTGKEIYLQYCASCHGKTGHGDGPAAIAMKPPPTDLTTLAKRNKGQYPAGYVGALLKFGRSLAAHGSDEMPVWGARFKALDSVQDPTGQQHVEYVVAYVGSLQVK